MTCVNKQYSAIQIRRGLNSEFEASNIVLASGEPAFATDEYIFKIGDGVTPWNNLDSLATSSYVDNLLEANDAMLFKGTLGVGGTIEALPSIYDIGWSYKVTTAGTYASNLCEVGDLIIAIADRPTGGGNDNDWVVVQSNIGDFSVEVANSLVNYDTISDPCDTSEMIVVDNTNAVKKIPINQVSKAISEIDGGEVIHTGC